MPAIRAPPSSIRHPEPWNGSRTRRAGSPRRPTKSGWRGVTAWSPWCLGWHVGLGLAHAAALVFSYPAWGDWVNDWWVRLPFPGVGPAISLRLALAFGLWLAVLPAAWGMTHAVRRLAAQPSAGLIVGSV